MNQKLQKIIEIIQQSEKLDVEQKNMLLKAVKDADKELEITAFKLERTEKVKKTTAILLEETIEELEQKRKAVEEQNRELEIESSLERVRTVAMGMNKSEDLLSICEVSFKEFQKLGFDNIRNALIHIQYDEKKYFMDYDFSDLTGGAITKIEYGSNPIVEDYLKQINIAKDAFFQRVIKGDQLKEWKDFRKNSGQKDDPRLDNATALYYFFFSIGVGDIGISTLQPIDESKIKILKRFRNVFDLAYRRYTDITQAEAQAREAQIEAALERVRSRSIGMQKSEELQKVIKLVYEQFVHLKINVDHAGFVVDYTPKGDWHFWIADQQEIPSKITHPYFDSVWANQFDQAKEKGIDFFATNLNLEEKNKFYRDMFKYIPGLPEASKEFYFNCTGLAVSTVLLDNVGLYIENFSGIPYSDEENKILMRFGKVFQQTYTRFLDLQKAEAQAREAQIEAALERVRARSMAMHNSNDVADATAVMFTELEKLGIETIRCGIDIMDESKFFEVWASASSDEGKTIQLIGKLDSGIHPHLQRVQEAWERGDKFISSVLEGHELEDYYKKLSVAPDYHVPITRSQSSKQYNYDFFFKEGGLFAYRLKPFTEEEILIMQRFTSVFGLTFRRYLDLKKAEAQTRESQIQLALERVRARTMAMHKSEELSETSFVLFEQLKELGENAEQISILIYNEKEKVIELYATIYGNKWEERGRLPFEESSVHKEIYTAWKESKKSLVVDLTGKRLSDFNKFKMKYSKQYKSEDDLPKNRWIVHNAFFSQGVLTFSTHEPRPPETLQLLERFAGVFDLTYTRFLDLQKAEAQAREAQIQLALERIRARTMAMQHSEELSETSFVLFQQFAELGIVPNRFFIGIVNEGEGHFDLWITEWGGTISSQTFKGNFKEPLMWKKLYKSWKVNDKSIVIDIYGNDLIKWNEYLEGIGFPVASRSSVSRIVNSCAIFSKGFIAITTPEIAAEETVRILERFATVFDGTYTRFLDLKNAEAQTREAQIEAALERVRAKTMAMHKSDELADTAAVVFQQLINLGIEPNRIYIAIIKDDKRNVVFWITNEDGSKVSSGFEANLDDNRSFKKMLDGWNEKKKSITIDMRDEELQEYFNHLTMIGVPFKRGLSQKRRLQYIAYFSKGFIGVASPDETKPETLQLLERFAAVFNLTYTRFNDLKQAEAQNKIIQTENERKTKELEEARQLQLSLLPRDLPKLPNLDIAVYMKTATEVGGDYYDFNVQENGTLDIGFGDATGHGLQAGTMITLMKGFFTSDVSRFTPEKFLEHCNSMIRNIKLGRILMSFSHLRIERKRLLISSAGMPPVYYNHKEYNRTEEIMIQGLPLGALQNTSYNLVVKELKRGDTILLLTDGLPEQMNNRKVIFDYSRVLNYFDKIAENTPNEIMTNLVKEAEEWMCGQQQADDITFVVIKVL